MAIQWDEVNLPLKNFYGYNAGFADNAVYTEFSSGRRIGFKKNSRNLRTYALTYKATRAQEEIFDKWYDETLGGNGVTFEMSSLRRGETGKRAYQFTATPTSTGQAIKAISINLVEA